MTGPSRREDRSSAGLETWLLTTNAIAAMAMAAIAWLVQCVQYPMLRDLPADRLPSAAREHGRRIGPLVVPLMAAEALAAVGLLVRRPPGTHALMPVAGFGLLVGIWGSTAAVQAPQHAALRQQPDPAVARNLVRWNLPRTLAWSARAALGIWMLARGARANPGHP